MKISATIIALNEEKNIARAIRSVAFVDEIVVLDSGSSDNTAKIAKELGAIVYQEKFLGHGRHKNIAAQYAKNDWILNIDADEEVSEELRNSIMGLTDETSPFYEMNRRTSFCGKWIYHGGWYPDFLPRLYNKNFCEWTTPHVHERLVLKNGNATPQKLHGHLNHYSFLTVESQFQINLKYAKLGASDLIERKKRRPLLHEVFLRPIGKFFECYVLKKGFFDGLAGLVIAINASYSMFMKYSIAYWDKTSD